MATLQELALALMGSDTDNAIKEANPYYRLAAVPDEIGQTAIKLYAQNPQEYSKGEGLAWALGSGLLSGILGGQAEDYQNTLSDRYISAVKTKAAGGDIDRSSLSPSLFSKANKTGTIWNMLQQAQSAEAEADLNRQITLEREKANLRQAEALANELFKNPKRVQNILATVPEVGKLFGVSSGQAPSSIASPIDNVQEIGTTAKPKTTAADEYLLNIESGMDSEVAKTIFQKQADQESKNKETQSKKEEKIDEFLGKQYEDLEASKQNIDNLRIALQGSGKTGGILGEDTARAANLALGDYLGGKESAQRRAARKDLESLALPLAGQIRSLFTGATSNLEFEKYLAAVPNTGNTQEQNKALVDRMERASIIAEQRLDFIEEAKNRGYSLGEAQKLYNKLEKIVPTFKNGEVNPDRLTLDVSVIPFEQLENPAQKKNISFTPTSTNEIMDVSSTSPQADPVESGGIFSILKDVGKSALTAGANFGNTALMGAPTYMAASGATSLEQAKNLLGVGEGKGPFETFSNELAATRETLKEANEESPIMGALGSVGGAIFSPINKVKAVKAIFGAPGIKGVAGRAATTAAMTGAQSLAEGESAKETTNDVETTAALSATLDVMAKGLGKAAKPAMDAFRRLTGLTAQDYMAVAKGGKVEKAKETFNKALGIIQKEQGISAKELSAGDESVMMALREKAQASIDMRDSEIDSIIAAADEALEGAGVLVRPRDVLKTANQSGKLSGDKVKRIGKNLINKFNAAFGDEGATLADIQAEKKIANRMLYKPGASAVKEEAQNAVVSDLRRTIEETVDKLVEAGRLPKDYAGKIKKLNLEQKSLIDLSKAYGRKLPGAMSQDVVSTARQASYTTSGAGTQGAGNVGEALAGETGKAAAVLGALAAYSKRIGRPVAYTLSNLGQEDLQAFMTSPEFRSVAAKISTLGGKESIEMGKPSLVNEPNREATLSLFGQTEKKKKGEGMKEVDQIRADVSPLIDAVIQQESGGNAKAKSNVGAVGLMQLMPQTAKQIAKELGVEKYDLEDPETNKQFGAYYLKQLLDRFGGDPELALTAYHSGPTLVSNLLKKTGGSTLDDIMAVPLNKGGLGPVGRKYARQVLGRISNV